MVVLHPLDKLDCMTTVPTEGFIQYCSTWKHGTHEGCHYIECAPLAREAALGGEIYM